MQNYSSAAVRLLTGCVRSSMIAVASLLLLTTQIAFAAPRRNLFRQDSLHRRS